MSDEIIIPEEMDEELDNTVVAEKKKSTNDYFRQMFDRNFLDYASYVIGSRAIPDVDDGLKPVQRRILWVLYQVYDGRTQKVANIVGNTMHYHPHGDASIGDALVVLANKGGVIENTYRDKKTGIEKVEYLNIPYFIMKQGNFGNILTGSRAAAGRYTECGLTKLAHETMFNNDITAFIPNYDGRKEEPVVLPAKVPSLLMMGSDGIAVGMSTCVLPHNFNELIDAEIAILENRPFQLYPDFQQGALMDVRDYDDGNGRVILRAKIDIEGRDLIIREIPASCTTESLVNSIERAAEKNKIRISSVDDFTTDHVEIRIVPTRGYTPEQTLQGLYMYTDCSVSLSSRIVVLCDRKPVQMTVSQVLRRNVEKLTGYLRQELEIDLARQNELRHAKTLAQIFFENRIYKKIEECKNQAEEYREVHSGLAPFRDQLLRDITDEDIDKLLALPVRRIARFDIEKNQQELRSIADKIKEINRKLKNLVAYTIQVLTVFKEKYGSNFPRRTEIERMEQIDRKTAALSNIKVSFDRKTGYVGTQVKSDVNIMVNEFDKIQCMERNGKYRIIPIPDKLYVGKLADFRRFDDEAEYGVIYRDTNTGKYYGKRCKIDKFITDKVYELFPAGHKLEVFTPRTDAIYEMLLPVKKGSEKNIPAELNLLTLPLRSAKARGVLIADGKEVQKITHKRYLEPEEIAAFAAEHSTEQAETENTAAETAAPESVPATPQEAQVAEQEQEEAVKAVPVPDTVPEAAAITAETDNGTEIPVPASTAVTPAEPVKEQETADDDYLLPGIEAVTQIRKRHKLAAKPAAPAQQSDDDSLGIVQPEFGF